MYKKALNILLIWNTLFMIGYCCVLGVENDREKAVSLYEMSLDKEFVADDRSVAIGIVTDTASVQRVVSYGTLTKEEEVYQYDLCQEDYEILLRIVEAEAGGEDEDGKLLVANVVLNRMNNRKFPNTVAEVVLQRSSRGVYQFSPVASGSIWRVNVSEETVAAVERALMGEDISEGALYFASRRYASQERMRWFDENLTFLFQHGGHEFFM